MSVVALIVAAGRGSRFGYDVPKQYMSLNGKTILRRSIEAFLNHPKVENVAVVINQLDVDLYKEATKNLDILDPIIGGDRRQDSVRHGLEALAYLSPSKILIHDVARPFVEKQTISGIIAELDYSRAVIPGVLIEDTVKKCENGKVLWTVDRSELWRSQTPQGFLYQEILNIHQLYKDITFTDDCAIAEHANIPVTIIPGTQTNFKITTDDDVERAEHFVISKERHLTWDLRIGSGSDIHRFDTSKDIEGNEITIGCTKIPYKNKIIAHSDGDLVVHAIIDALLGSMAMGDIGSYFPPSDEQWKNADSAMFIKKAIDLLREKNGRIKNIDITIITQEPKIGKHRDKIQQNLAKALYLQDSQVSVKAKTNEGLDAVGRGEAIACNVSCLVEFPAS